MPYAFNNDKSKVELLNYFYPVGTIYETTDNDFVPDEVWGGTWEKVEGRFLLGSSNNYNNGSTGGSADAVVVSHSHTGSTGGAGGHFHKMHVNIGGKAGTGRDESTLIYNASATANTEIMVPQTNHTHSVTITSNGVSGSGKNMPPYLVVHIWKRVS